MFKTFLIKLIIALHLVFVPLYPIGITLGVLIAFDFITDLKHIQRLQAVKCLIQYLSHFYI